MPILRHVDISDGPTFVANAINFSYRMCSFSFNLSLPIYVLRQKLPKNQFF